MLTVNVIADDRSDDPSPRAAKRRKLSLTTSSIDDDVAPSSSSEQGIASFKTLTIIIIPWLYLKYSAVFEVFILIMNWNNLILGLNFEWVINPQHPPARRKASNSLISISLKKKAAERLLMPPVTSSGVIAATTPAAAVPRRQQKPAKPLRVGGVRKKQPAKRVTKKVQKSQIKGTL